MSSERLQDESIRDNPVEEATNQTVHDPVCHMDIVASNAVGTAQYEGLTYYFCSTRCNDAFNLNPAAALKAEAEHENNRPVENSAALDRWSNEGGAPGEERSQTDPAMPGQS